jgi:hypothetical protein
MNFIPGLTRRSFRRVVVPDLAQIVNLPNFCVGNIGVLKLERELRRAIGSAHMALRPGVKAASGTFIYELLTKYTGVCLYVVSEYTPFVRRLSSPRTKFRR